MILPMKKITLLCLNEDQNKMLHSLQDIGMVHITHCRQPLCSELEKEKAWFDRLQKARDALPLNPERAPTGDAVQVTLEKVEKLVQRRKELEGAWKTGNDERQRVLPYGNFDPARISSLAKRGVNVRLYRAPLHSPVITPEGSVFFVIRKDRHFQYFALVGTGDFACDYEAFQIPEQSLAETETRLSTIEKEMESISEEFDRFGSEKKALETTLMRTQEKIGFMEVKAGMGSHETISCLQGYCPAAMVDEILKAPSLQDCGSIITDPSTGDDVPTLIRNPKWVRPVGALFNMIHILPGYREKDISAVFLIFFCLFSALLIGDAGYGICMLLITMVLKKVFSNAPSAPFLLLGILGICTTVWGILTGNYFGISAIPAPYTVLRVEWLTHEKNIIHLCFLIGSIHLTVAHAWNAISIINSTKAVAQIGWIGMTWTMYMIACTMILDAPFPAWGSYLLSTAFGCIVLFTLTPGKIKQDWQGLMMLPLNIISNFVDIVSYLRLFAVGSASLAVATSFNEMAWGKGINPVLSGGIAAMILFLGHGLNIALMALGILVHGVRLNTLEFAGHVGIQWKGIPYHPFSKTHRIKDRTAWNQARKEYV